jgi:hypothetical protein
MVDMAYFLDPIKQKWSMWYSARNLPHRPFRDTSQVGIPTPGCSFASPTNLRKKLWITSRYTKRAALLLLKQGASFIYIQLKTFLLGESRARGCAAKAVCERHLPNVSLR